MTYACQCLAQCRHALARLTRSASLVLSPIELIEAAVAAYNAGPGPVASAIEQGRDPDIVTTEGNYSKDVLGRAAAFRLAGWG